MTIWNRKSRLLESSMTPLQKNLNLVMVCCVSVASVACFWDSQNGPEIQKHSIKVLDFSFKAFLQLQDVFTI